jgi:hypothetical protein
MSYHGVRLRAATDEELAQIDDCPLDPKKLAAIWRSLPERDRYRFMLALTEDMADQVIRLTYEEER